MAFKREDQGIVLAQANQQLNLRQKQESGAYSLKQAREFYSRIRNSAK